MRLGFGWVGPGVRVEVGGEQVQERQALEGDQAPDEAHYQFVLGSHTGPLFEFLMFIMIKLHYRHHLLLIRLGLRAGTLLAEVVHGNVEVGGLGAGHIIMAPIKYNTLIF